MLYTPRLWFARNSDGCQREPAGHEGSAADREQVRQGPLRSFVVEMVIPNRRHPTRTQRENNKCRRRMGKMLTTITNPSGPSA
jgi:hypothetical protein